MYCMCLKHTHRQCQMHKRFWPPMKRISETSFSENVWHTVKQSKVSEWKIESTIQRWSWTGTSPLCWPRTLCWPIANMSESAYTSLLTGKASARMTTSHTGYGPMKGKFTTATGMGSFWGQLKCRTGLFGDKRSTDWCTYWGWEGGTGLNNSGQILHIHPPS